MKKLIKMSALCVLMFSMLACQSKSTQESAAYGYDTAKENDYAAIESGAMSEDIIEPESEENTILAGDKLVYRGALSIQTLKYEESLSKLKETIQKYQGIIAYENASDNNYYWYKDNNTGTMHVSMEVRIPTEHFSVFIDAMDDVGKVLDKNTSVENITKQYNDNAIQIEALNKQETRLLEMLDQATTIEEMILVEERLTDVQTKLNLLNSAKSQMDTDIQYSNLSITLDEVKEYVHQEKSFFTRFKEAVVDGWKNFIYGIGDFIIDVVYHLPSIILFGFIVFIAYKAGKKFHLLTKIKSLWK